MPITRDCVWKKRSLSEDFWQSSFKISYSQKSFLNGPFYILDHLLKLNKGQRYSAYFSKKFSLYKLDKLDQFQYQTFFAYQDVKQIAFLNWHDGVINFRIYVRSASSINSAIADRGKKEGKVQKSKYLRNYKRFFGKMKSIFHIFSSEIFPNEIFSGEIYKFKAQYYPR